MHNPTPSEIATLKQRARWRILLRNGKFQEEFNALRLRARAYQLYENGDGLKAFSSKWGVNVGYVLQEHSLPSLTRGTIALYESRFDYMLFGTGVLIWDAYHPTYADEEGILYSWNWEPPEERGQRFMLDVDVSACGLDLALRIIETELRSAVSEGRAENLRCKKTTVSDVTKQKRDRLDKLEFQLKVFDMAQDFYKKKKKKLFNYVAINLRAKPSTVKSAYWAACYKIGVEGIRERTRTVAPSVTPLIPPCPFDQCQDPTCREAQGRTDLALVVQGLCEQHKTMFLETQPSFRESIGHDLSRIEHAKEKQRRSGHPYVKRSNQPTE